MERNLERDCLIEEICAGKKSAHTPALPCVTFGRMEAPQEEEKICARTHTRGFFPYLNHFAYKMTSKDDLPRLRSQELVIANRAGHSNNKLKNVQHKIP